MVTRGRIARLKARNLIMILALFLVMGGMIKTASAYMWTYYRIPSYNSVQAWASINGWSSGSSAWGNIQIYKPNSTGCYYVQRKPVATFALDGDWKRSTENRCSAGTKTFSWGDSFHLNYSGFKFRICRDVFGLDPCGSPVTVYPYR